MATEPAILYRDEALLVIDKPAGLLAVPGRGSDKQDCLSSRMQRLHPEALVVHRLDMATSGLMLMARSLAVQQALGRAFAQRSIGKTYEAVVQGRPVPPAQPWGDIELPIHLDWPQRPRRCISHTLGKPSHTRWRVLGPHGPAATRLELQPITGRSHQLRVHMLAIGHPILGDGLYAAEGSDRAAGRLLLHASRVSLVHPCSGQPLRFESPAPF